MSTLTGLNSIGIIFDGDDTLWETQALYIHAKKKFFNKMERLGFDPVEVEQRFEKIDVENVQLLGFEKARFPRSMSDTYQTLCQFYGKPFSELIRKRVESIGYMAFGKNPKIFDGAIRVLKTLHAFHFQLILATKGDKEVQEEKISFSKVGSYFHRVYVFPEKGESELRKVAKECSLDLRLSWSIGNSMKSDINPALRIGMKAIWIPKKTWEFEEEAPFDKQNLFIARSIKEVPNILKSQMANI
jgi:putative hydrolase of the HAD superfamily